MVMNPWAAEETVARRSLEFERQGDEYRMARQAAGRCPPSCHRGPLARRTGRFFVSVGWRLGGTEALPAAVQRRLA